MTAEGTSSTAFTSADWATLTVTSLIWGASFLFIAEGLEAMEPGVVTALRVGFGCLALTFAPAARTPVDREDWPRLLLLGVVWFAIPMTMFPLAEQWISSSVTGMLNGALPIFSTMLAAVLLGRLPGRFQIAGLAIGFAGAVLISVPSLGGGSGSALGVALVIVAVIAYAVAGNLMVPLQQRYGSIPVIWRSMAVGLVVTLPYGLVGLPDSRFEWSPFAAVLVLGNAGHRRRVRARRHAHGQGRRDSRGDHRLPHPGCGNGARRRAERRARRRDRDRRPRARARRRLAHEPRRTLKSRPAGAGNLLAWVPCAATSPSCAGSRRPPREKRSKPPPASTCAR
ncbi:MAG: DMT family transporter [Ilumatobacteraceae bacterium]